MKEREVEYRDGRTETLAARTTDIQVALKPGADLNAARDAIERVVRDVERRASGITDPELSLVGSDTVVQTWRQSQARYLDAVQNEVSLVTFLFGLISI